MASRVLIVGGGTGATMLANTLDRRRFRVTMVTDSLDHLFQPALLYIAFADSRARVVRDERRLLPRHVELVHDRVAGIDLLARTATTAGGRVLDYDQIVIATGISTDPAQIPGLAEVSDQVGDYHSTVARAKKLWAALEGFAGGTIALGQASPICKCPPSPVEGILLLDRLLRRRGLRDRTRLVFFTPYPRAYSAAPMNEIVEPLLRERGIEVMTFFDVDRIDPDTRTISSIEGDRIECDLPIVIPPFVGAEIAYHPPEVLDEDRFVVTDRETLRVRGVDSAFAIGDATNLPTSKSGVGAHLEAKVVARQLAGKPATFRGRTHCPLDLGDGTGTFVTGSYDAAVVKSPPTRVKHLMKLAFARIYWLSLRGWLEPAFDAYFRMTEPERRTDEPAGRPTASA
ncbi:MAG TPA: FAD-dependent oxidoreductase [Marmoricola sp.]|nr:FAD-dependent oxidoreductase [Marmoricola sp.]